MPTHAAPFAWGHPRGTIRSGCLPVRPGRPRPSAPPFRYLKNFPLLSSTATSAASAIENAAGKSQVLSSGRSTFMP